jgi:hypothetical protein
MSKLIVRSANMINFVEVRKIHDDVLQKKVPPHLSEGAMACLSAEVIVC